MFVGTSSAGETLQKLWGRIGGTVVGVGAGIAVAELASGKRLVEITAIVGFAAIGLYFQRVSYGTMVFCITIILGLLYSLLGQTFEPLLVLRLEETAIGGLFGGLAATLLWPVHTAEAISLSTDSYLDALNASVHASVAALNGESTEIMPQQAARSLDGALAELIARGQPVLEGLPLISAPDHTRRAVLALSACSFYARRLARSARNGPCSGATELRDLEDAVRRAGDSIKLRAAPSDDDLRIPNATDGLPIADLRAIAVTLRRLAPRGLSSNLQREVCGLKTDE